MPGEGFINTLKYKGNIFVDKSLFIKKVVESEDRIIFITRPRVFGRSLTIQMIQMFLECNNE